MKSKNYLVIVFCILFTTALAAEESESTISRESDYAGKHIKLLEDDVTKPLPIYFNWKKLRGVTPSKYQGEKCNTCWAFGAAAAIESKIKIFYGEEYDISEQQIISCGPGKNDPCNKAGSTDALEFYLREKPILEKYIPYQCLCKINKSECCPDNAPLCSQIGDHPTLPYIGIDFYFVHMGTHKIRQLKLSILRHGPAVASIRLCSDFFNWWKDKEKPRGSVYCPDCQNSQTMPHVVLIVGWDDIRGAFLCKDNWGKTGPEGDGTFWLAYPGKTCTSGKICNKNTITSVSNISVKRLPCSE